MRGHGIGRVADPGFCNGACNRVALAGFLGIAGRFAGSGIGTAGPGVATTAGAVAKAIDDLQLAFWDREVFRQVHAAIQCHRRPGHVQGLRCIINVRNRDIRQLVQGFRKDSGAAQEHRARVRASGIDIIHDHLAIR